MAQQQASAGVSFVRFLARPFSTTRAPRKKHEQLPPRPSLPDSELKHTFVKGSGPGGQKINKTNSAAQVTHLPTGIVVKCQATRSRSENFKIAKRILAEKVEFLAKGDESRAAKVEERARRKKASQGKKTRRKYKRLAGESGELGADADADADADGEEDGAYEDGEEGGATEEGGDIRIGIGTEMGRGRQMDNNETVEVGGGQYAGNELEVEGRSLGEKEEGARVDGSKMKKLDSGTPPN
ncbi:hypothetical protein H2202_004050 [Exophiala xenobiotica]|nr:hypothetical protein H2202_004050 [Exophiala xenobiotica]KAK5191074.1 hypothetical protein LTR92_008793 [Exophiala xenobiotica]KAK5205921.1 hypothetical protein LTR41_008203 [Exophiala xenobiotica]KAK5234031.1 hypothetical protein LTR47_005149 [Exophiala xenobiotica]KAK5250670.1 hypothetical protein LTS06_004554 [Exophiala xenobiotica]